MTTRPKPQMELLRRVPAAKNASRAAEKTPAPGMFAGDVRLNVGIPEEVRFAAKKRAMEQRLTLRAYILRLLAKDGIEEAREG